MLAIFGPKVTVRFRALAVVVDGFGALSLRRLRVSKLDDFLCFQTHDIELNARQKFALVLVIVVFLAIAIELQELRHVIAHVRETCWSRRFGF